MIRLKHFIWTFLFLLPGQATCYSQTHFFQSVINEYTRVTGFSNAIETDGDTVEVVTPQNFAAGDRVIMMVMKGAEVYTPENRPKIANFWGKISNIHNTGYYSIHTISEISGNQVVFHTSFPAIKKGVEGEIIQLIRVPEVETAILDSTLSCSEWDPVAGTGGVLALIANNKIVINKGIDVTGKGFRGGNPEGDYFMGECSVAQDTFYLDTAVNYSGKKGEGIVYEGFPFTRGLGFVCNAGGGGNARYSGGGGGGLSGTGGIGGMESEKCSPVSHYGGRGRFIPVGFFTNTDMYKNRAYLGGGGGCSTQNPDSSRIATRGGNGGGIVILITDTLQSSGATTIRANGETVHDTATAGGGGGGGAGMIILDVKKYLGHLSLSVRGGNGGYTSAEELTGPGGFGGGGFIWFSGDSLPGHIDVDTLNGSAGLNVLTNSTRGAITSSVQTGSMMGNLVIPMAGRLFNSVAEKHVYCSRIVDRPLPATAPKGGDGIYSYKWIQSEDRVNWEAAAGVDSLQDYLPSEDADTMYFRRIVSSGGTIDTSNICQMVRLPAILNNRISGGGTVCDNEQPAGLVQDGQAVSGGSGQFYYLWEILDSMGNIPAPGINTLEGYVPPLLSKDTKFHRIVYSDWCSTISNEVEFKVDKLPWVTQQPEADTIGSGESNIFSIKAEGTEPLFFQWFCNENEIGSATKQAYAILDATTKRSGDYYCRVTNHCGSTFSDTAVLLVLPGVSVPDITDPDKKVFIYPNPASDYIRLNHNCPEPYEVILYDALGNKILESHNKNKIPIESVPGGVYFVSFRAGHNFRLITKKIVVIK